MLVVNWVRQFVLKIEPVEKEHSRENKNIKLLIQMKGVNIGTHSYINICCSQRHTLIDWRVDWSDSLFMCDERLTTRFTFKTGTVHRTCRRLRQQGQRFKGRTQRHWTVSPNVMAQRAPERERWGPERFRHQPCTICCTSVPARNTTLNLTSTSVVHYNHYRVVYHIVIFIHSLVFSLRGRAGRNQSPVM